MTVPFPIAKLVGSAAELVGAINAVGLIVEVVMEGVFEPAVTYAD